MTEMFVKLMDEGCAGLSLTLTEKQKDQFFQYYEMLIEWNKVMNLTAITEPAAVAQLHFLDSMAVLNAWDCKGKKVIDVGCGAGFPGVPMAIAEPTLKLTLLDSLQKRMNWLQEVLPQLEIPAQVVAARAEEYVTKCRETYDVAVSRAVARLNVLCELCLPYVKVGGAFLALKGAMTAEEVTEAENAIRSLGGKVKTVYEYPAADAMHKIVVIEKVRPTPGQYPRKFSRIKQSPL
jgi:16S rRNA (guanine527-N7)-methyltransferase